MKFTNLKIYYTLIFSNNLWFITSNWLNFWLKFMTMKEVGIIDAVAFLTGILIEFPSGVISDRLGRKQTLLISQSLQLLGSLIITLSTNLFEIGLGFVLFQIGVSFYSGTIESFGYEAAIKEKFEYSNVLVLSGIFSNFSYLISLLIGGYLYTQNDNYPNILFTLNFIVGFLSVLFIKEVPVLQEKESKIFLKSKFNLYTVISFVVLMTVVFAFDYGFLKLFILDKFSTIYDNYWYIFSATLLSLFISSLILKRIQKINKTLIILFIILTISFLLSFISYVIPFFILSFLAVFVYQLSLKYINEKIEDSYRASVISLFNLVYKLPYVLIALILGYNLA
jgi:MFS family permease